MSAVIHWNTPNTRTLAWRVELDCSHSVRRSYPGFGPVVYPVLGEQIACPDCAAGKPRASYGCPDCRFGHGFTTFAHMATHKESRS